MDPRQLVGLGWDDGVRFAAEVLRSQVFPKSEAREACVDRILQVAETYGPEWEDIEYAIGYCTGKHNVQAVWDEAERRWRERVGRV